MTVFSRKLMIVPLVVLASTACASLSSRSSSGDRPDPDVLEMEQVEAFATAYEAVQTLRSNWLRRRVKELGAIVVYYDGTRAGSTSALRWVSTPEIASIRYYDGIRASQRWGLGHENGAIVVNTRVR